MIGFVQAIIRPAYLILTTLIVSLISGLIALVGLQINYAERVFPGVRFQGADLSGKRRPHIVEEQVAENRKRLSGSIGKLRNMAG